MTGRKPDAVCNPATPARGSLEFLNRSWLNPNVSALLSFTRAVSASPVIFPSVLTRAVTTRPAAPGAAPTRVALLLVSAALLCVAAPPPAPAAQEAIPAAAPAAAPTQEATPPVQGATHAAALTLTPYHPSGIYALGERVGWTVSLPTHTRSTAEPVASATIRSGHATQPASAVAAGQSAGSQGAAPGDGGSGPHPYTTRYRYTVKRNNFDVIASGRLDLARGPASIEVRLMEPAMLYMELSPVFADGIPSATAAPIVAGAAVAPERLLPSIPRPADFDSFWKSKIAQLERVPIDPVLTAGDSGRAGVEYATFTLNNVNGTHVHGQLAKPSRPGRLPGLVIFQWASPPYPLQKAWVTDRAAEGWLAVNIEPHDVLPDQPASYYEALPPQLKNYQSIGRDDRDRNYFLQMYLADHRAIDYLASRPDWDGRTLVVMGTSMGGQQSLCAAGLDTRVTGLIVNEPSGADANGPLHGRAAGYPNWPADDPRAMATAQYFDTVNCATHIRVPSMVAMGFVDTTAPPVGIWIAFNQIRAPKEAVPMIDSPHNNFATPAQQRPYTQHSARWLGLLVQGQDPLPAGSDFIGQCCQRISGASSGTATPSNLGTARTVYSDAGRDADTSAP